MRGAAPAAADTAPLGAEEFAALMEPLGPFGPAPRLVAGVSGGPHSLALALLADRWARARGGVLTAVVCDHGLRPGSAAEASGVARLLEGSGIGTRVAALGLAPGPGAQERARDARFAALLGACAAIGAPWLLLGHHRADQAETVLLRGLSGSGAAGLAGMAAVRPAAEALVIRPLLGIPPARLEAVVASAGLPALRDPSNADPRFDRARVRGALADPDGEGASIAALAAAAVRFAARRDAAAEELAARLAACATLHEEGFVRIDLPALGRTPPAQALLGALVRLVGGRSFAPPEEALARLLAVGRGTLGGALLRGSGLLLPELAALAPPVPARAGAIWGGRFRLQAVPPDLPPGVVTLGAAGPVARTLPRPGWLPAAVVPTLPALHCDGTLAAVPALAYPSPEGAPRHAIRFAPVSGPVA